MCWTSVAAPAFSLLVSEIGHNVAGIDLSDGMLGRAKEKAYDPNLRAEFRIDAAEKTSGGRCGSS